MAKIPFDKPGEHLYETGVSECVLYVQSDASTGTKNGYANGVAWNGITTISENPTGAEVTKIYADNINYLNLMSVEEMEASVSAYTYPDAFAECDGSVVLTGGLHIGQQPRKKFCICYKTKIGNDETSEHGVKFHVLYGCLASPSERSYETVNDSPEAIEFTWDLTTTPVPVTIDDVVYKPTAHVEVSSTDFEDGVENTKWKNLMNAFYGKDASSTQASDEVFPQLQLPSEIYTILNTNG